MDKTTVPTHEMIQNLAEFIVNGMSFQELTQFVQEERECSMLEDRDVWQAKRATLSMEPEDFTNEKFRGEDD